MTKYTVYYWIGTNQFVGQAQTVEEVEKLCKKNRNAYLPTILDSNGNSLTLTIETMADGRSVPVLWNDDNPI